MPRLIGKYFRARKLRGKGYSFNEISRELNIAKSTASVWLRDIRLSKTAIKRLKSRRLLGAEKTRNTKRLKREEVNNFLAREALDFLNSVKLNKDHIKLFCALLFECEGTKDTSGGICFVNSDPRLIKTFLFLLRSGFKIKEKKLRVVLHLHDYHSERDQIVFWSKLTDIPKSQFSKPYRKPHTGKRVKDEYQGCVSIRYYDSVLARRLAALSRAILDKYGRVG